MDTFDELLNQLGGEEVTGEINFYAPDPGAFKPPIPPTPNVEFRFYLPADFPSQVSGTGEAFEVVTRGGKKCLQVNFGAVITYLKADGSTGEKLIPFQRATTYKSDKMLNSSVGELIRSLDLQEEFRQALQECSNNFFKAVTLTLSAASGRAVGHADIGWTAYFKDSKLTFKTSQGKRRVSEQGYVTDAWPRLADKSYAPTVTDGQGEEKYAQLELVRFRVPKKVTEQVA